MVTGSVEPLATVYVRHARSYVFLENALREAFSRRHNYIGTEHLLLGLLAERRSAGAKVLRRLGVTQDATAEWLDTALADLVAKKRSGG